MTTAIIIGGGVAGPATAAALQRVGIDATVYEAHPGPGEGLGAFLTLAPNGLAALRTLGMLDAAREAASFPTTRVEMVNGSGRRLGLLPDGSDAGPAELRTVTIDRGTLQRALADAAREQGVRVEYGKRFVGHSENDGTVTAAFADGSTATGDLLLGCDGIHSPVRRAMDPHAPEPAYTGLAGIGGYTSGVDVAPTPDSTMRMVFGRRAFFGYQTAPSGEVHWFANLREAAPGRLRAQGADTWRQHVLTQFRDDLPDITTTLEHADAAAFRPLGIYDLAPLPRWSRGRTALLGDAAHAVSSSSGQGASLAIEDAVVLAACLRDGRSVADAFAGYEQQRRGRVARVAAEGRRRGNQKAGSSHPAALLVRDTMLRVGFALAARFGSQAWMHGHRVDLAAPAPAG